MKNPAVAGGVFVSQLGPALPGDTPRKSGRTIRGRTMVGCTAATGKVHPLARPQVVEITPSGFGFVQADGQMREQSTSPKIGLRRRARSHDGELARRSAVLAEFEVTQYALRVRPDERTSSERVDRSVSCQETLSSLFIFGHEVPAIWLSSHCSRTPAFLSPAMMSSNSRRNCGWLEYA
jgi:hypothetical protein